MAVVQQPDMSTFTDKLTQHVCGLMEKDIAQLKKRAKKRGVSEKDIEAAAAIENEDDAKNLLIRLIIKGNSLVKEVPSPTRSRRAWPSHTCRRCEGCIRPPAHEGNCMDGQCNEIFPPSLKPKDVDLVAEEMARHQTVKDKVMQKVADEEEAKRKAAEAAFLRRAEEARREAEEKARLKAEEEAAQKRAAEEAARMAEEAARKKAEEEAALQRAAEEEARRRAEEEAALQRAAEEEARRRAEEEARLCAEEEAEQIAAEEEAARLEELEELERAAQEEEEEEREEMDRLCVETFLACTQLKPSGQPYFRAPLKGTILYTKQMRPCRPPGTSVKVQDSNFYSLSTFLQFLEGEGLLTLKPGETDPVVTSIRHAACAKYEYVPGCWRKKATISAAPSLSAKPSLLSSIPSLRPSGMSSFQ